MAFWKRESGKLLFIQPDAVVSVEELDSGHLEVALSNGRIVKLSETDGLSFLKYLKGPEVEPCDPPCEAPLCESPVI